MKYARDRERADVDSFFFRGLDANMQSSHAPERPTRSHWWPHFGTRRSRRNRACSSTRAACRIQSRPLFFFCPIIGICCHPELEDSVRSDPWTVTSCAFFSTHRLDLHPSTDRPSLVPTLGQNVRHHPPNILFPSLLILCLVLRVVCHSCN